MSTKTHTEFIARGLLIHQGRVLMCKNIKHGYCFLPGGHIEYGERAHEALIREIKEETGLESSTGPLLLTSEHRFHDGKREHHELNVVFHVEHIGESKHAPSDLNGESRAPDTVLSIEDHIEFVWIDLAQLPETDVRPNEVKAWLMSGGATSPEHGPWISGFSEPTASN